MLLQVFFLTVLVLFESTSMHGLPCSSLGDCFHSPSEGSGDASSTEGPSCSSQSMNDHNLSATAPVTSQPEVLPGLRERQHQPPERTDSHISACSSRARKQNGTNSVSSNCHRQNADDEVCFQSPAINYSVSLNSEGGEEEESDFNPATKPKYPQIPRPSIIIRLSQV